MKNKSQYIWSLLGRFLPSFTFLLATIILARLLTPDDFGLVGVLAILFTVAGTLTDAGLGGSLIKEKTITDLDCSTIFNFNIVISSFLYIILFFSADFIESYFNMTNLSIVTRLLSLSFVINAFSLVPKAIMMRRLQFKELFFISIISTIIGALLSIGAAYLGMGVYALIIYYLSSYFITSLLSVFCGRFRYSLSFSLNSFRKLVPFGLFTSISAIIDTIYENILSSMFGKVMGVTVAGNFYQAKKTEEAVTSSLASSVGLVAFPVLAELKDDKEGFIGESRSILLSVSGILFPAILLLSIYSDEVILLLYGNQWIESALFFKLLMFAGCFMIIENLNRSFIKSLGLGHTLFNVALVKRGFGISLLFLMSFVNKEYLVHTYIACSFIGYLINQISLSKYLGMSVFKELIILSKVLIPNLLLLLIINSIRSCFNNYFIEAAIETPLLLIYYYVYLPQNGINLAVELTKGLWLKIKNANNNDKKNY